MLKAETPTVSNVVRVGVSNNFNCTPAEFKQLNSMQAAHPGHLFFVNSNVNTPGLPRLNDHPYQAVITLNPTLDITDKAIRKLYAVDRDKVAFVRVKYLPARPDICAAVHELAEDCYKVVITPQRFNGYKTLDMYTSREYYHHDCSRMRLTAEAMLDVDALVDSHPNIYHCDRSGEACPGCMNCAKLTTGSADVVLASLNLSTSGLCPYSCPDCFAKTMQHFVVSCGNQPIQYDVIKRNKKQQGATTHAKHAKKGH